MRFVVLHHTGWAGRPDHYDLLLEVSSSGGEDARALAAFATAGDRFPTGQDCRMRRLENHRRFYLSYEGAVSGGRGQVVRADAGELAELRRSGGVWTMRLEGRRLRGCYRLVRGEGDGCNFGRAKISHRASSTRK
jgi:hypothetical protein